MRFGAIDNQRLVADLHAKLTCFEHPFLIIAHESQVGRFDFQRHRFGFARLQLHFVELAQPTDVGSEAGHQVAAKQQHTLLAYHYKERFNNNNYLRSCFENKSVTDVAPGADNKLWIATLRHGLYLYDSNRQRVEHMDVESFYPNQSWRSIAVTQMLVDGHDDLWLSLSNNKLLRCSYTNGRLVKKDEFNIEFAKSLIQDEAGIIWVGTTTNKVYAFRPGANTPQMFQMHQHYSFIPGLLPLDDGRLLVLGFYMPPKVIDPRTNVISDFPIPEADQAQCIRRSVFIPTTVKHDSEGDIWIARNAKFLLCHTPKNPLRLFSEIP